MGHCEHGGKREGAGRPHGRVGRRSEAAIRECQERFPGWSPLIHMARVANDSNLPEDVRLDAAKAAAPYFHPKLRPVEANPDELVTLEARIAAARLQAQADILKQDDGALGDQLLRALARVDVVIASPAPAAPAQPVVIDAAPVPEPRVSRAEPSRGHPLPAGPQGDWTRPEAIYEPPQRQAFVDHDYENAPGTLLSSRDWE